MYWYHPDPDILSFSYAAAPKANVNAASAAFLEGKLLPGTEEIVHDRFLSCIEREDAKGAMAHFSFIACEGGVLLALRRRQLLVLLCEKDMVKEASELLSSATSSPAFNSQDLSTIVSVALVIVTCTRTIIFCFDACVLLI